jgi:toxin ParE1/3/4
MKKYDVVVDQDAEDDLFDIYTHVALDDSIERAEHLFSALRSTCHKLKTLPLRGNIPAELFDIGVVEFREIHYKHYRVFYSVEVSRVFVHCVLDGKRDIQTILQERLLR